MYMAHATSSLVGNLKAHSNADRLHAVRKIKNEIIGNKRRKVEYVEQDSFRKIAQLLKEDESDDVRLQSAIVLGSLSRLSERNDLHNGQKPAYASSSVLPGLLSMLSSESAGHAEAALKALCSICKVNFGICW